MAAHARLSPSSAHRWMRCTGSVPLVDKLPPAPSSVHADEGTFCHEAAALCLEHGGLLAVGMVGFQLNVNGTLFTLEEQTAREIDVYIRAVREFAAGMPPMVELSLPIENITGEDGARGTADCVIVVGDELQVHDLKMGRGVEVDAEDNEQLMMYALAALEQIHPAADIKRVRGFIHQPRLSLDPKVATWTPEQLRKFGSRAAQASVRIMTGKTTLVAGEKQCRFCPARSTCPELKRTVDTAVRNSFDTLSDEDELAEAMSKVELVELWAREVRAEVERRLLGGRTVPGYKLVQGRKGNRQWQDAKEAARLLEMTLGDSAYTRELISVAQAERALKGSKYEETWAKRLAPQITQSPGRPSVAPASDKRPAISAGTATTADFSTIED